MPDADPGKQTAERWRKRFCFKGETSTIVDKDKMALALDDAKAVAPRWPRPRALMCSHRSVRDGKGSRTFPLGCKGDDRS